MRVYHRYLGFFLAGIMAVYALSGIVLIFRNTEFLKFEKTIEKQLEISDPAELGEALKIRDFKITGQDKDNLYFEQGSFNKTTGIATYKVKEYPTIMAKMTKLHKAKSDQPLFYLNIFFGLSLLFFVLSAFFMFIPSSSTFKKGLYFTLGGIVLTFILLFV